MDEKLKIQLMDWAEKYNDPVYFQVDPIIFPREFLLKGSRLQDIEIAAVFAAHFAWGRRSMIVRDCQKLMDQMEWKPYDYVMSGEWRDDPVSIHRTIKWSDTAMICQRLKDYYSHNDSLEPLSINGMRESIFAQKNDPNAPNKKICMMRRWMVRRDNRVDLGLWKKTSPKELLIPLDVHVHSQASALGLCIRKSKDLTTAKQITEVFKEIFPEDPLKGDFALFGYGVSQGQ